MDNTITVKQNGRNGKPIISDEKVNKVKELVKVTSIRKAAEEVGIAYSTAWEIKNGFFDPDKRMMKTEKVESKFFEHDKFYSY